MPQTLGTIITYRRSHRSALAYHAPIRPILVAWVNAICCCRSGLRYGAGLGLFIIVTKLFPDITYTAVHLADLLPPISCPSTIHRVFPREEVRICVEDLPEVIPAEVWGQHDLCRDQVGDTHQRN